MLKNKFFFIALLFFISIASSGATAYIILNYFLPNHSPAKMMKIKEPLLIGAEDGDDNYYTLPPGTVLYYVKGMAEGHQLYLAYFYHQGTLQYDEVPMEPRFMGNLICPLWLYNIDVDLLKDMFKQFPVSKKDLAAAAKANGISRRDLLENMQTLPE